MKESTVFLNGLSIRTVSLECLVIGTGCAGFNTADWLYDLGKRNIAIVTEGVNMGTSRNTGSDKQTYYKLSLCADQADSVADMARGVFEAGGMHGDIALCEAANSVRCFMKLVNLGVPFPTNEYGEFVGYKTDHDPLSRATSVGPLTSKCMTEVLERQVNAKGIPIFDHLQAVRFLLDEGRICGVLCVETKPQNPAFVLFECPNVMLAVGGPADIYQNSVFPISQTGMTGMAVEAGAKIENMNQWQYGIDSMDFRWNLSGSYQQVLPRYVSIDSEGVEYEFLPESLGENYLDHVFFKGYEWPFDSSKLLGSSQVDLAVYEQSAKLGRKVYLDYMRNPKGLAFDRLCPTAYEYLKNSGCFQNTPIERLRALNPNAIRLYLDNGIDLSRELLRVDVCAQHCNGGLAVDANWQTTVPGLYAAGEVAGTYGMHRPGGAALNSSQVGSLRAAQHIAWSEAKPNLPQEKFAEIAKREFETILRRATAAAAGAYAPGAEQRRLMTTHAAQIRDVAALKQMKKRFEADLSALENGTYPGTVGSVAQWFKNRDRLISSLCVIVSELLAAEQFGTCGSCLLPENPPRQVDPKKVVVSAKLENGGFLAELLPVRPMPAPNHWFETVWQEFNRRSGTIV